MKKMILIGFLILIILVSGCIERKTLVDKEDKYDHRLDLLIIQFNEGEYNGLIANSNNNQFKQFLDSDFDKESNNVIGLKKLTIDSYFSISNGATVSIIYEEEIDNSEKGIILDEIKKRLEEKWYVGNINYELFDTVHKN